MRNWAKWALSGYVGDTSFIILIYSLLIFFGCTVIFIFGNTIHWVYNGMWLGSGWDVYLRISILMGGMALFSVSIIGCLVIFSNIIDRYNKKVHDYNSELG